MSVSDQVLVRQLAIEPYTPTWEKMQAFTDTRDENARDEIWLLQHEPVFTQGQAGKAEHLLATGDIPVVQVDRGGQVTYHGPGQLIVYLMINLRRRKLGVREMVDIMERTLVDLLADYGIDAYAKPDAPGVYVENAKIASLGLRVRRGCSFHGLALNLDMDMEPFLRINPCGYAGMPMTQLSELTEMPELKDLMQKLVDHLVGKIGYTHVSHSDVLE